MKIVLNIYFLLIFGTSLAQDQNRIIELLRKEEVAQNIRLNNPNQRIFKLPNEVENRTETQEIIKQKEKFYVTLNGTSKVFINTQNDSLVRLDETRYDGFNFGSINISYNDTIFSIGGYGFWTMNGGVRYFDVENKEWDIIKTNRLVNVASGINCIYFFDEKDGKLYIIYEPGYSEYIQHDNENSKLLLDIFDFKLKNWIKDPFIINNAIAEKFKDLESLLKTENGIIINSIKKGGALYLDFRNNITYEVNPGKITEYVQLRGRHLNNIIYTSENSIKLYDLSIDSLFSVSIDINEMKKTKIKVYDKKALEYNIQFISFLILLIFCIILMILVYIQKNEIKKINKSLQNQRENKNEILDFISKLEELEKIVLKLVYQNNLKNINTSTNQLNKILGTEKKDLKIQNNIRSEIILSINKKFRVFTSINEDLIERERSDIDKRHMEYSIHKSLINKLSLKFF